MEERFLVEAALRIGEKERYLQGRLALLCLEEALVGIWRTHQGWSPPPVQHPYHLYFFYCHKATQHLHRSIPSFPLKDAGPLAKNFGRKGFFGNSQFHFNINLFFLTSFFVLRIFAFASFSFTSEHSSIRSESTIGGRGLFY